MHLSHAQKGKGWGARVTRRFAVFCFVPIKAFSQSTGTWHEYETSRTHIVVWWGFVCLVVLFLLLLFFVVVDVVGVFLLLFLLLELCESRGGRPGLSVITSLLVSVDVKNYWTVLWHCHNVSLICQLTSEDIKQHFIICMQTVYFQGPITNLLSVLCVLTQILSGRCNAKRKTKMLQNLKISLFCCSFQSAIMAVKGLIVYSPKLTGSAT